MIGDLVDAAMVQAEEQVRRPAQGTLPRAPRSPFHMCHQRCHVSLNPALTHHGLCLVRRGRTLIVGARNRAARGEGTSH